MFSNGEKKERAIPFITLDEETGKFEIPEKAQRMLKKIKGKVGVVCIAGLYRTGKSYVLNRLLGRQHGFQVGGTVNACTKGIYTWGKPFTITNAAGEEITILLMDTEGIGAFDRDTTFDSKILSFGVLLSSLFVYNSVGVIDESALEKISFIANLSKHIHVQSGAENHGSGDIAPYFPSFVWLLRDFGLKLVNPAGDPISEKEYLENALTQVSREESKNEIRKAIMNAFTDRDCMTLVRPVVDEEELQELDKIPYEQLRDKFKQGVELLRERIFKKVRPKLVFNKPINGAAFLALIETYITAMNTGAVPTIKTAWSNVSEIECKNGLDLALQSWHSNVQQNIESALPLEEELLTQYFIDFKNISIGVYDLHAVGDHADDYRQKLLSELEQERARIITRNDEAAVRACSSLLVQYYNEIDKKLQDGEYFSLADIVTDWKRLVSKYLAESRGRNKHSYLAEFLLTRMPDGLIVLNSQHMEKLRKNFEDQIAELRLQLKEERDENRKMVNEFNTERKALQEKVASTTQQLEATEKESRRNKVEAQRLEEEMERVNSDLRQISTELDTYKGKATKFEKKVLEVTEEKQSLLSKTEELEQNLTKEKQKMKCVIQ